MSRFSAEPPKRFIQLEICMPTGEGEDAAERTTQAVTLKIPLAVIVDVAVPTAALKYLAFVGGCILGAPGGLIDKDGQPVDLSRPIGPDDCLFRFSASISQIMPVKAQFVAETSSEVTTPSPRVLRFRDDVKARDKICLFTRVPVGQAARIIGHAEEECMSKTSVGRLQVGVNQAGGEDDTLDDIDDPRNGMFISSNLHTQEKEWAVIKTPNFALGTNDIQINRVPLDAATAAANGLTFPKDRRTAHWLTRDATVIGFPTSPGFQPLVSDAAFAENSNLPHESLLHYVYGCKAVSAWADKGWLQTWTKGVQERVREAAGEGSSFGGAGSKGGAGTPENYMDVAFDLVSRLWEHSPGQHSPVQHERNKELDHSIHTWQQSVT
ncbi:hypothetical protein B0H15DRAFT_590090 [Mycena belliarum]|uniref:HNH nuclease domain-containing protein n=1 Tax=Mycena belliarum TaxID=1033014 RepID=A0AAD6UDZ0_9AGAR|nr:hypothetical protein B0H15DRAFT_590090 [Mycena belliae]